jgi:YhcH/YjgK/YiaL family protein
MILDTLQHGLLYSGLSPIFKKAFEFLIKTDLSKLALGKHDIDGEDLFVLIMTYASKDVSECAMESHKKYIDIQYLIEGEEIIHIATLNGQVPTIPYDKTKDIAFYSGEYTSAIKLEQGNFAIFFPHDLHMPCIKAGNTSQVQKAVFKIAVEKMIIS